jgi:hypothetical protein
MHDALRLARRAGGVSEEVRRFRVDLRGRQLAGKRVELERREHHVLDGWGLGERLLDDLEHRLHLAAP